jgi:RNase H-like domain found in reverse transcriptase
MPPVPCRLVPGTDFYTTPLTNLTKSKIPFEWNHDRVKAFDQLKEALMNTPILRCADSSLPYEVQADASETGIGAVLEQKDENGTRPVAYMSRKLNAAEQNYTVRGAPGR